MLQLSDLDESCHTNAYNDSAVAKLWSEPHYSLFNPQHLVNERAELTLET